MPRDISEELQRFSEVILRRGVPPETFAILTTALEKLGPEVFARRVSRMFSSGATTGTHRARSLRLADHLAPSHVFADQSTELWGELVDTMLAPLAKRLPEHALESTRVQLNEGGTRPGWFPGGGIALPHVTVPDLDDTLLLVAQTRKGLNIEAMDGEPIRLVFLLLDSPGDPERHLLLLAHIATVCGPAENRGLLLATAGAHALHDAIIALDYDPVYRDHN